MAFEMHRVDRVARTYAVTVTDDDNEPVDVDAIAVALLPPYKGPTDETTWETLTVTEGEVEVVFAGPLAVAETGDLLPPIGGTNLFFKEVDGAFVKAEEIERIIVR